MQNKNYFVIKSSDVQDIERLITSEIDRTDAPYYYGMLEVLRWMKDRNIADTVQNILQDR